MELSGTARHLREQFRTWQLQLSVLPRKSKLRAQVKNRNFTVVSSNCWGSAIYRDLKLPYLSPFIGLYLMPEDFMTLLERFPEVMSCPLTFTQWSTTPQGIRYPVGLLDGTLAIHFVHYASEEEARTKWDRRRQRMVSDPDRTFFMFCDRDGCTREHLERFERLPFRHKVAFVSRPMDGLPHAVFVPSGAGNTQVQEGLVLYDQCHDYFSVADWLNGKDQLPARA